MGKISGRQKMNRKGIFAVKRQKNVLIIIGAIVLLGIVAYIFQWFLSGGKKSQMMIFAGNAVSGEQLSDVSIALIQGRDNPLGESFCQIDISVNEETVFKLPYGEYTIQWSADGYYTSYQNVEVSEKETLVKEWLVPILEENTAYILVEWETEIDIDLCVYNEQTGRCIGKETAFEDAGSFSYGDDSGTKGYELVFLQDYDRNEYGVYVKSNPYPEENQTSSRGAEKITVSIYTPNGLLYQRESDSIQEITLWHCADIRDGQIKEWDEYISDLTEYAWAARDKANPQFWIENTSIKAEEKYKYSGGSYRLEINKFDVSGNQTACFEYGTDGEITHGYEKEYDENGDLITGYTYEYEEGVLLVSRSEYIRDERGYLLTRYTYECGEGVSYVLKSEYAYDESGNRVAWFDYDRDGKLSSKGEREYDTSGNLISVAHYDADGELVIRDEFTYDGNGNELSHRLYGSDGLCGRWEYEYDDDGNKIVAYGYEGDGSLDYKVEYGYDENGNYIGECVYDEQGISDYRTKYEYDEDGNLAAFYEYGSDGGLTEKIEYDIHGKQTAIYAYEDGVLIPQHINVFDENENPIEYYEYRDGKLRTKIMREFNENGECTLICVYNGNGSLESRTTYNYVYEYDAIGGMKIFYYYVDDVLTTKTITLFY